MAASTYRNKHDYCADGVLVGDRNVIMMTQVAAGTYQCVKAPFQFRDYMMQHINCRKNIDVCIPNDLAAIFILDHRLFTSLIRNLINNAEVHGASGGSILVEVNIIDGVVRIRITNMAGANHAKCLELQETNGRNFLLNQHNEMIASTQQIGSADSTFLGMREITDTAALLDGRVDILFEERHVVSTLELFNIQFVQAADPSVQAIEAAAAAPEPMPAGVKFIVCDDDKAPRSLAKGLLKKLETSAQSLILGETMLGVADVPSIVSDEMATRGPHSIVCMFDQNMHWPEGSILGTQLSKALREVGFEGLIIIRSANDSESYFKEYREAGADVVLSKGMRGKEVAKEVGRLYHLKRAGAKNGFGFQ